jgi:hypothetical protein
MAEGQVIAAVKGNHGGRPKVIDDDSLTFALALKDKGVSVPAIAKKLTIKTGKNVGSAPSVASLYRAFAEADAAAEQAAANDGLPPRPKPARIRQADEPETPAGSGPPTPPGRVAQFRPLLAAALLVAPFRFSTHPVLATVRRGPARVHAKTYVTRLLAKLDARDRVRE